jgi:putative oxygen-independent coproporphyrinogen III oxidase
MQNEVAIYVHWPFCKAKCPYCDFNSHVSDNINNSDWQQAYLKQIKFYHEYLRNKKITSIFFGGGTPSIMHPKITESIIDEFAKYSDVSNIEITLEANPTSSSKEKFQDFKQAGINRLSIGVQSFNDKNLQFLGREHNSSEALQTIDNATNIFNNFSFDLMYALPEQNLNDWENELQFALKLARDHLSMYQLTIEKGTRFYSMYRDKKFIMPSEDLKEQMYDMTYNMAKEYNLHRYEISNYAQKGKESVHNLNYWNYREYLGIGPGAHGRIIIDGYLNETVAIYNPKDWLFAVNSCGDATKDKKIIKDNDKIIEKIIMGLRIDSGILIQELPQNFLTDYHHKIIKLQDLGLLQFDENRIYLTYSGSKLYNCIISEFFA